MKGVLTTLWSIFSGEASPEKNAPEKEISCDPSHNQETLPEEPASWAKRLKAVNYGIAYSSSSYSTQCIPQIFTDVGDKHEELISNVVLASPVLKKNFNVLNGDTLKKKLADNPDGTLIDYTFHKPFVHLRFTNIEQLKISQTKSIKSIIELIEIILASLYGKKLTDDQKKQLAFFDNQLQLIKKSNKPTDLIHELANEIILFLNQQQGKIPEEKALITFNEKLTLLTKSIKQFKVEKSLQTQIKLACKWYELYEIHGNRKNPTMISLDKALRKTLSHNWEVTREILKSKHALSVLKEKQSKIGIVEFNKLVDSLPQTFWDAINVIETDINNRLIIQVPQTQKNNPNATKSANTYSENIINLPKNPTYILLKYTQEAALINLIERFVTIQENIFQLDQQLKECKSNSEEESELRQKLINEYDHSIKILRRTIDIDDIDNEEQTYSELKRQIEAQDLQKESYFSYLKNRIETLKESLRKIEKTYSQKEDGNLAELKIDPKFITRLERHERETQKKLSLQYVMEIKGLLTTSVDLLQSSMYLKYKHPTFLTAYQNDITIYKKKIADLYYTPQTHIGHSSEENLIYSRVFRHHHSKPHDHVDQLLHSITLSK